jgi:hypothetical protein
MIRQRDCEIQRQERAATAARQFGWTLRVMRTPLDLQDQRGFTIPQMGMGVGIIGLVLFLFYLFFARCT